MIQPDKKGIGNDSQILMFSFFVDQIAVHAASTGLFHLSLQKAFRDQDDAEIQPKFSNLVFKRFLKFAYFIFFASHLLHQQPPPLRIQHLCPLHGSRLPSPFPVPRPALSRRLPAFLPLSPPPTALVLLLRCCSWFCVFCFPPEVWTSPSQQRPPRRSFKR